MSTIGFDTSNYTTSVAFTDGEYDINVREILYVKNGERGIRQSDGVFQHIKLIPKLYDELSKKIDTDNIKAVGVSTRPREVDGSYMPVFCVGESVANIVADTLGVPVYKFSHQDGHIMAGIYSDSAFELLDDDFISVHLSGGTTEILKSRYNGYNFTNEIIGGTSDISVGQYIDRVGVRLGLKFPAGKMLEELALSAEKSERMPMSVSGTYMSFSGVETKASRMADITEDKPSLARGVLENSRDILVGAINNSIEQTGVNRVLVVGGVASNSIVRDGLKNKLNGDVYFAKTQYSTDNAVGIAYLAYKASKRR